MPSPVFVTLSPSWPSMKVLNLVRASLNECCAVPRTYAGFALRPTLPPNFCKSDTVIYKGGGEREGKGEGEGEGEGEMGVWHVYRHTHRHKLIHRHAKKDTQTYPNHPPSNAHAHHKRAPKRTHARTHARTFRGSMLSREGMCGFQRARLTSFVTSQPACSDLSLRHGHTIRKTFLPNLNTWS